MSSVVLDASAVLAVLFREAGGEKVLPHLAGSEVCAVNHAEVVAKAVERGAEVADVVRHLHGFQTRVIPFDEELAVIAAALRPPTRSLGLSLADRACLALGVRSGLTVLTAERRWLVAETGAKVKAIR